MQSPFIFSHDLARMMQLTASQVRRDMMLVGISGNHKNGYNVNDLVDAMNNTLSLPKNAKATIIGMGDLGQALLHLISRNKSCPADIPVTFDTNIENCNQQHHKIPCVNFTRSAELIQKHNIKIAILTTSASDIQEIVDSLVVSGIRSFVNISGGPFRIPEEILLKDFDIRTAMDELSYFVSQ